MTKRIALFTSIFLAFSLLSLSGCGGGSDEAEQEASQKEELAERLREAREDTTTKEDKRSKIAARLGVDLADMVEHESGLEYIVLEEGTGEVPEAGDRIRAHYTGYLLDGTNFDSSVDRGKPYETEIGVGKVIEGWDIAFTEMKVGEKRVLFIPPDLGYGAGGSGRRIPPNAELVFRVELLDILE